VLVFLVVKVFKVEEVCLFCLLDGLQAVHDCDRVHGNSVWGISVKKYISMKNKSWVSIIFFLIFKELMEFGHDRSFCLFRL
jgi:hypothetical protein